MLTANTPSRMPITPHLMHATPSTARVDHLLQFLQVAPAAHPENTLRQELVLWKHLDFTHSHKRYAEALSLATSTPFDPAEAKQKFTAVQQLERKQEQDVARTTQALADVQRRSFNYLALESTLPNHKNRLLQASSLDWLNLELPRTRRLLQTSARATTEVKQLTDPQSHLELSSAALSTERKISRFKKALNWIKAPLNILVTYPSKEATVTLPPETRSRFQDTYQGISLKKGNPLGKGSFGQVRSVSCHQSSYALKEASSTDKRTREFLEREASVYMSMKTHPNITCLQAVSSEGLYLQKVKGKNLREHLDQGKTFTPAELKSLLIDIAKAIEHVHVSGNTYKDLKPENILLDVESDHAKLCDFGLTVKSEADLECSGSVLYRAPEVLRALRGLPVTPAADVWSFGVLVYHLVTGYHLLDQTLRKKNKDEYGLDLSEKFYMKPCNPQELFQCVDNKHKRIMKSLDDSSDILQKLIVDCLHGDPKERPTMTQVIHRLSQYKTSNSISSFVRSLFS